MALIVAFSMCLRLLNALYLVVAVNKKSAVPFQEIPDMIICALARSVGTIIDTQPDGSGAAPVWSTFWSVVESCVAPFMTAVIAICSVFISQIIRDDRLKQANIMQRFGHRLFSTLRLSKPSRSSRH
ncbi:hypothetical protein F4820DRAFT_394554 [Hypoxylon rubiginosum]|uniref:Uncharacterized protein n=1 Tax=Hypoxylon rubiginosum TaxID=110542 RepID=A0ACB9YUF3_9PEZI|nr:hypothetical protein F4820DRAFT_394554 [Hypoxylon rubiginosum]